MYVELDAAAAQEAADDNNDTIDSSFVTMTTIPPPKVYIAVQPGTTVSVHTVYRYLYTRGICTKF